MEEIDTGIMRKVSGQTICITTFVFTQIIILLALVFSLFMALLVFFRMRQHRKTLHINRSVGH